MKKEVKTTVLKCPYCQNRLSVECKKKHIINAYEGLGIKLGEIDCNGCHNKIEYFSPLLLFVKTVNKNVSSRH
jgi:hypothetical protein